ncbi:hypothetical protein [Haloarcula laminariae]|uniref:hypothetical protein n=1 Tax=Haloarcula laminariae TaxID=2961577 RepID=UPI0024052A76|nr:hypothetical protein [Halomicroarcula sp. FL173]
MANDTTKTTDEFDIEYPTVGYDATPTWAELYGQAFEDIDSALADRLVEEEVEDAVDALLSGGDKVSVSYDDANDAITIETSALDDEEVRDEVGQLLTAGNAIDVTVDDAGDSVTLAVDESAISHDNISDVSEGDHRTDEQVRDITGSMAGTALAHEDPNDSIDVQREQIEDWIGGLVAGQGNISVTYDDANDSLQIDTSGLNTEEVQDAVSQLVAAGDNLSWNYDDGNDVLTVSLSGPITGVQIGTDTDREPGYFSTLDTADALNSDIGDGVDYLDPFWMAETDRLFKHITSWPSLSAYAQSTSNGGSITTTRNGSEVEISPDNQTDSKAQLLLGVQDLSDAWTLNNDGRFRYDVQILDNTSEAAYLTVGEVDKGALSSNHLGVAIESGDLIGTVGNDTTQTKTTLISNVSSGDTFDVLVDWTSGSEARFVVNGTEEGTITSNLPNGSFTNISLLSFGDVAQRMKVGRITAVSER